MKLAQTVIIAVAILAGAGCGTIISRPIPTYVGQGIYPATRTDGNLFWACASGNSVFQEKGSGVVPLAGYTVVPLCFLLDMPISLVTDTIMLPIDIHNTDWQQVRERRAVDREMEYQQSLTLEDRKRIRDKNQQKQMESNKALQAIGDKSPQPER